MTKGRGEVLEGLYFLWIQIALTALAARGVGRWLPRADPATSLVAGLVLFVTIASGSLVVLGAAGMLDPLALAVALTLALIVAVVAEHLRPVPATSPRSARPVDVDRSGSATLFLLAIAAGVLAWWGGELVVSGIHFVWDDFSYHAATPSWWLQQGRVSLPPFNFQSYFPANAALLSLWFILPFGSDGCANLTSILWLSLVLASCWSITRRLGHSRELAIAGMLCFLASPHVIVAARSFSAVDLAAAGMVLAALALVAPRQGENALARAGVAGLAAGLALGIKVTMAPLVLLVGLHELLRARSQEDGWRVPAAFAIGVLATGSYWYASNLVATGNPVFPAAIGPFEGPFDAAARWRTSLISFMVEAEDGGRRLELARQYWDWPLRLGLISLLGYAAGLRALTRVRDPALRRYLVLLLVIGVLLALITLFQPFSGSVNRPSFINKATVRYLTLPFAMGLILLGSLDALPRRVELGLAAGIVGVALSALLPGLELADWGVVIVAAALAYVLLWGAPRLAGLRRFEVPALMLVLWGSVALLAGTKDEATRVSVYSSPLLHSSWTSLESLPEGSRIASLSHDPSSHTLYRMLFGWRHHLTPVPVLWTGAFAPPLHTRWRDEPDGWWWEFEAYKEPMHELELVHNLRAARVDYVLVSKSPRDPTSRWPRTRALLAEALAPDQRVFADKYSEIWRLAALP